MSVTVKQIENKSLKINCSYNTLQLIYVHATESYFIDSGNLNLAGKDSVSFVSLYVDIDRLICRRLVLVKFFFTGCINGVVTTSVTHLAKGSSATFFVRCMQLNGICLLN